MRLIALIPLLALPLQAATYYVDFVGGSDAAAGTSSGAAWQHCPGDANATGTAAAASLSAGDTIYFKGGVRYVGKIDATASGTTGVPITYDGEPSGWGSGKAIIDGTATLTWNVCTAEGTGATEVNNPNFASIYYASLPASADWRIPVFEGDAVDDYLTYAGSPNTDDPWFYNDTDFFEAVASGVTAGTITDAAFFNQASSSYWLGGIAIIHITGNAVGYQVITNFNTGTDTVSFANAGTPYQASDWDNLYHYTVIGAQPQITIGTYAVDTAGSRILVWPTSGTSGLRVGDRTLGYAFHSNGKSFITIKNFKMRGQYGTSYVAGRHITGSSSTATDGVLIHNCDLYGSVDYGATAAIYTYGAGTSNNVVRNNLLTRIYGRGIFGTGNGFTFQSNELSYVTGTVLYSQNNSTVTNRNGQYLDNYIHDCSGVHANGMTIYGSESVTASDFLVARNRVIRQYHRFGPYAVSIQGHKNVHFENNVLDGGVADDGLATGCEYSRWLNNTISKTLRIYGASNSTEFVVKNNICLEGYANNTGEDWADWDKGNNLYETAHFRMSGNYGWSIGTDIDVAANAVFGGAFTDGTITASSPAYDAGADLSALMILDVDVIRTPRSRWDIGAFEYQAEEPQPTTLNVNTLTVQGQAVFGP